MEAQQLTIRCPNSMPRAVRPGKALVPEKVMQNRSFYGQPSCRQVIHLHGDESSQHAQLDSHPHGSHQREAKQPDA